MDLTGRTVAVIGAGFAGASTAKALSLLGADVTVYEQAQQAGEVGAGIGLRPSSLAAFREWGSLEAIQGVTSPSHGLRIFTPTSEPIHAEEWPEKDVFGLTTHFIHRRDFIDALLSVLPEGMVAFGHRLVSVVDNGDSATVSFQNGTEITADLVVAADGITSRVRGALFSEKPPVFAHEHAYRAVFDLDLIPGVFDDDNDFHIYFDVPTNRHLYLVPLKHRGQVSFDITVPSDDDTWSPKITRERLIESLAGFDDRFENVTRTIDLDTVNCRSAHDIDSINLWHTDSIVLVGDAAHAMLHHQGQGANSAILGAKGLADALRDADSIAAGLSAYQAARKPITDEYQRISRAGWDEESLDDGFPGQHGDADRVEA
ncbi:FAD-dependent oxidoreductase [Microbacterium allomyrinae]|uniref:FAD-dependent monooxygenase n=1 Tax=Microbacterium allomyrinae TaxID=2830666 RepID=A0A9X1LT95_9MICO|nr:NAD(P)/FAD-dependent oxidoreductase [Microbacterium allomyrinae]MCC2031238.1 FAD-dependent monooxygenase [Microbacterium allomyrinae]